MKKTAKKKPTTAEMIREYRRKYASTCARRVMRNRVERAKAYAAKTDYFSRRTLLGIMKGTCVVIFPRDAQPKTATEPAPVVSFAAQVREAVGTLGTDATSKDVKAYLLAKHPEQAERLESLSFGCFLSNARKKAEGERRERLKKAVCVVWTERGENKLELSALVYGDGTIRTYEPGKVDSRCASTPTVNTEDEMLAAICKPGGVKNAVIAPVTVVKQTYGLKWKQFAEIA